MNLFKRIVTTVHSGVDRTVASMENHEAIVDAALKQSREALMRAKIRLSRLEKEGTKIQNRTTELISEIDLWSERARTCAELDRPKAITCLQRKQQREKELLKTREQLQEHEQIIKRVRGSINESTNRIETLQMQRNHMRSREAAAQVGSLVHNFDKSMDDDVENAIERWEIKVGQSEIMNNSYVSTSTTDDDLATEFNTAEENLRLEAELDALLHREAQSNE